MREAKKYELAEIEELENDVQDLLDNPDKLRNLLKIPTVRGEKRALDHIEDIGATATPHNDPVDYIKTDGDKGEIKAVTINKELRNVSHRWYSESGEICEEDKFF